MAKESKIGNTVRCIALVFGGALAGGLFYYIMSVLFCPDAVLPRDKFCDTCSMMCPFVYPLHWSSWFSIFMIFTVAILLSRTARLRESTRLQDLSLYLYVIGIFFSLLTVLVYVFRASGAYLLSI